MAKTNNTTEAMGFNFAEAAVSTASTGRTIPGSTELISTCNSLALDAIKLASTDPEIGKLAAAVQSGDHDALCAFVDKAIKVPSADILDGATEDELSRLLESRRSDRSKAKKAGLTTLDTIRRYISAWVAELVIREKSGKAYRAPSTSELGTFESTDRDEITKKIKSLQSKKCRLNQAMKTIMAAGIDSPELKKQLDDVDAEIQRLNAMRGTQPKAPKVSTVDVVPSNEQLRAVLAGMTPEEIQTLLAQAAG
jgi:hypothetical protein